MGNIQEPFAVGIAVGDQLTTICIVDSSRFCKFISAPKIEAADLSYGIANLVKAVGIGISGRGGGKQLADLMKDNNLRSQIIYLGSKATLSCYRNRRAELYHNAMPQAPDGLMATLQVVRNKSRIETIAAGCDPDRLDAFVIACEMTRELINEV